MRVGISLLTLVPGEVGGAETSARGLCRGLAEVGTLDYAAFTPPAAPGAGEGLPETLGARVPTRTQRPGTRARDGARGGAARQAAAALRRARRRPLPADDRAAPARHPDRGDGPRPPAPRPPRALLARRAALPGAHARGLCSEGRRRDRAEPVRPPPGDRAARAPTGERARDRLGCRPRALPARRRAAGAVPALSGPSVAAQEPRAALRGVRAPPARRGPSSGSS